MTLQTHYRIPSAVILQIVDDEALLFNSDNGLFFTINEVGNVMWEVMNDHTILESVLSELTEIFDVSAEQLSSDLMGFTQSLAEQGLIVLEE
jgi:hypothetical protein